MTTTTMRELATPTMTTRTVWRERWIETNGGPPAKSLVTKLAEIMGEVERVAKRGRNDFHKYDYATEADIVAAVRIHMVQRNLMMIPNVESLAWRHTEKGQPIATLTVRFTLVDGDSAETLHLVAIGEGQDAGDKCVYKAMTGATKYALLKLFLIPTGDDPEREAAEPGATRAAQRARSLASAPYREREAVRQAGIDPDTGEIETPGNPAQDQDDNPIAALELGEAAQIERETLLKSLRQIARKFKLSPAVRARYWELHCGTATTANVDPSALSDMYQFFKRCEREGIDPAQGATT